MNKSNHNEDADVVIPEERFSTSRRPAVIAAARDAWAYFNQSRVEEDSTRFIGTTLAIIGTIAGIASSVTSMANGVASRTPASDPVRLTLRIHNYTPFVIVMRNVYNVTSRLWSSPVILSGRTLTIPYAIGTSLNARPTVRFRLVDEQSSLMNISFTIADNGRFLRVIQTQFNSQTALNDPFSNENHEETGIIFYRGSPVSGVTATVVSSTITNGMDGELDVAILTSTSIVPTS